MQRVLLVSAAAAFFIWENVAASQWFTAHGGLATGLAHAWTTLRADQLVFLVWTDMGVFALAALAWLARDLRLRGHGPGRRAAWLGATLVLGSPALLVYLAFRQPRSGPPAGVATGAAAPAA